MKEILPLTSDMRSLNLIVPRFLYNQFFLYSHFTPYAIYTPHFTYFSQTHELFFLSLLFVFFYALRRSVAHCDDKSDGNESSQNDIAPSSFAPLRISLVRR